jgi:hypothetical protein
MSKIYKILNLRLDKQQFDFLNNIAKEEMLSLQCVIKRLLFKNKLYFKQQEESKTPQEKGFETFSKLEKQRILANQDYFFNNVEQFSPIDCNWTIIDEDGYGYNYETGEFCFEGVVISEEKYMQKKYEEITKNS